MIFKIQNQKIFDLRTVDKPAVTEYTSLSMRSSLPDDTKIIFIAVVILAIIGVGIIIQWLRWPVWLIAIPAVVGAILVWLKLRQEE